MKKTTKKTTKKTATKTAKKTGREEGAEADPAFAPVVAAFASDRDVTRKRMFGNPNALTVSGKIFAMLTRGELVAKVPRGRVDQLVREGTGTRFDPGHGRLMKEWVSIPGGRANWVELAREAHRFVKEGKA